MSIPDTEPLAQGWQCGSQGLGPFTGVNQVANSEHPICSKSLVCPHDKLPDYKSLATCRNLLSVKTGK